MIVTRVRINNKSERMTKVTVFNEVVVKTHVIDDDLIELVSSNTFNPTAEEYYKVELEPREIQELIEAYDAR